MDESELELDEELELESLFESEEDLSLDELDEAGVQSTD